MKEINRAIERVHEAQIQRMKTFNKLNEERILNGIRNGKRVLIQRVQKTNLDEAKHAKLELMWIGPYVVTGMNNKRSIIEVDIAGTKKKFRVERTKLYKERPKRLQIEENEKEEIDNNKDEFIDNIGDEEWDESFDDNEEIEGLSTMDVEDLEAIEETEKQQAREKRREKQQQQQKSKDKVKKQHQQQESEQQQQREHQQEVLLGIIHRPSSPG